MWAHVSHSVTTHGGGTHVPLMCGMWEHGLHSAATHSLSSVYPCLSLMCGMCKCVSRSATTQWIECTHVSHIFMMWEHVPHFATTHWIGYPHPSPMREHASHSVTTKSVAPLVRHAYVGCGNACHILWLHNKSQVNLFFMQVDIMYPTISRISGDPVCPLY